MVESMTARSVPVDDQLDSADAVPERRDRMARQRAAEGRIIFLPKSACSGNPTAFVAGRGDVRSLQRRAA